MTTKINFAHYQGREHAYVKHYLIQTYLSKWGYKIGSKWDPLVFVDGFAGPWRSKDREFADTSFGIATTSMRDAIYGLSRVDRAIKGACIFVEKSPRSFELLNGFAERNCTDSLRIVAFRGRFTDRISDITRYISTCGNNPFKLLLLDQKGWASAPMDTIKKFMGVRGSELLFNVMTSFLTRFLEREDLLASYDEFFGRRGVVERIRSLPKGTGLREEAAVDEYCKSLRDVCGFRYVSQAIIMDSLKERIRYYLVFATNSIHGIEVFKAAEVKAASAQDEVRHNLKSKLNLQLGLPFGGPVPKSLKVRELHKRYVLRARATVLETLIQSKQSEVSYDDLYGTAMMFPLVRKSDLDSLLQGLIPDIQIKLGGKGRRKTALHCGDYVMIQNPKGLEHI